MIEYTKTGIKYHWEIVSSDGAGFILFPTPEQNTKEQIAQAKDEIRSNRDTVYIRLASEYDRDHLYKSEIFDEPEARSLHWYQINDDEELIRRERLKGTTPQEYVQLYVLPFIKETEEKRREALGDKIYKS